jgi:hypothetical protein
MRLIGVRSVLECDEVLTNARSPRLLTRRPWFPSLLGCGTRPSSQAVVLILHSLFVAGLRDLHLPPDVEGQVLQDVVAAEKAQVLETISTSWDATRLRIVTDAIAGSQWSAYLRVIWAGTRMEQLSSDVARNFGRVALLAGDITTADPRYNTLPRADRRSVLRDALTSLHALESVDTRSPSPSSRSAGLFSRRSSPICQCPPHRPGSPHPRAPIGNGSRSSRSFDPHSRISTSRSSSAGAASGSDQTAISWGRSVALNGRLAASQLSPGD